MNILDSRDLAKRLAELIDLRDSLEALRADRLDIERQVPRNARETKARRAELAETQSKIDDALESFGDDEAAELAGLESLESDVSEWADGATLIDADDFVDYTKQFAEDIGAIDESARWPCTCINWDEAADELRADYTTVTYLGTDYLVRA